MAAPVGPVVDPISVGTLAVYGFTLEISQAQFASLRDTTNALVEMPSTVTPSGFTNAVKITVSCLPAEVLYP